MTFLIVTNRRDLTTDYIVRELKRRELPYLRLNTESIAEAHVTINPLEGSFTLRLRERTQRLENVLAAYFRRPEEPSKPRADITPHDWEYAAGEWNGLLKSIYVFVGKRWFSHPAYIMLAEDKPRQLIAAVRIGFRIPEGVITNDFVEVDRLMKSGPVVGKPLKTSIVSEEGPGSIVFTSALAGILPEDAPAISLCPAIYQREIIKDADIRVTVVGSLVFAVAIHSQVTEVSRVDWRRGSNPELLHEAITLPAPIKDKCVALVEELNLRFGAIDLIRDINGEYWFLECNPNGQWAWIENRTGVRISAAIVDELEEIAKK
ncbi:hypothetical protein [Agrobacterium sp. B1(2019)]|uniref:hypothetical protein n=1 Tax=Agrobacterium sp. B1(2019) TaxID=2607032 RepID=UPI0011EDD257|nr:hypothetical protein [Agrobacterium sp. B1(2019)]TZG34241.1 hypothetical protein AGR1_16125 [Agrobacterium sp. B1(2019)]